MYTRNQMEEIASFIEEKGYFILDISEKDQSIRISWVGINPDTGNCVHREKWVHSTWQAASMLPNRMEMGSMTITSMIPPSISEELGDLLQSQAS